MVWHQFVHDELGRKTYWVCDYCTRDWPLYPWYWRHVVCRWPGSRGRKRNDGTRRPPILPGEPWAYCPTLRGRVSDRDALRFHFEASWWRGFYERLPENVAKNRGV